MSSGINNMQISTPLTINGLDKLNQDILNIILTDLIGHCVNIPLSTVSRSFRALCMPCIFKQVFWDDRTQTPPKGIWKYIRILMLVKSSYPGYFPLIEHCLPQMPELHTIRITWLQGGVPLILLKAIFTAPGLQTLEIAQSPYESVEPYDPEFESIAVPLRRFMYRRRRTDGPPVRLEMERIDPAVIQQQLLLECNSLSSILTQVHLTLETLLVPGETSQFDYLAYLSWPCLRELILYGVPPITDVSMSRVLSNMPSLRTLYLQFSIRRYFPGFLICPPESKHYPLPPLLSSLTLSWPSPDDQVFSRLAPTLRHLSLRDSPRLWGVSRSRGRELPYLSCRDVFTILSSNDFSALERLEIVYQGSIEEEEMLDFIAASFPSLYFLEIHRLRPNRWERPVYHFRYDGLEDSGSEEETPDEDPFESIPIDLIGSSLSTSRSLRILRINLDFYERHPDRGYESKNLPFDEAAKRLAEGIPSLNEVSLYYSENLMHTLELGKLGRWSTYLVDRSGAQGLKLKHQPQEFIDPDRPVEREVI